jgi:hypothetical protein
MSKASGRTIMTLKGLQDMRTSAAALSGSGTDVLPHKLHMRLCALEMERYRRDQERNVALERARRCEARVAAIETEVRALLEVMQKRSLAAVNIHELKPRPKARSASHHAVTHHY